MSTFFGQFFLLVGCNVPKFVKNAGKVVEESFGNFKVYSEAITFKMLLASVHTELFEKCQHIGDFYDKASL